MKRVIVLAGVAICVAGCSVLGGDFEKAKFVGWLRLRDGASSSSTVSLPSGKARLIIAVPGYRCAAPKPDASIAITIAGDAVQGFAESIRLEDLTWSFAINSCDAFGYAVDAPDNRRLVVKVLGDGSTARITARIGPVTGTPTQEVLLWLIYGDRIPTSRIYESHRQ